MSVWIEPSEPSLQKDVGPGDKTGVYYIPVCNLPFGTTWQELKDFTRTACDVQHVEVFKSSTSGWVQVKGRANFEKAWKLLDGGWFNGRGLIASDRNRDEPMKVKELIDTSSEAWKALPSSATYPMPDLMTGLHGEQFEDFGYPHGSSVTYNDYCGATIAYSTTYSVPYSNADYYGEDYGSTNSTGMPGEQWEASLPYHAASSQSGGWDDSASTAIGHEPTPHKSREVVVEDLPLSASPDQVEYWVDKKLGTKVASKIREIEVPRDASGVDICGYAIVSFRSSSYAKDAVKVLDRKTFEGHEVAATLVTDEDAQEREDLAESQTDEAKRDEEEGRYRHSKSKEKKPSRSSFHGSRSGAGSRSSKKSSDRGSRKDSKDKDKDRDKKHKDRRDRSPLVVDGSSKRRSKR